MLDNIEILDGIVDNIIYQNEDNGYTVFVLISDNYEIDDTVCVGYIPKLNEGEHLKITGEYITHPTYGKQFSIGNYEKTIPTSTEGMKRYLASGVVKGIGPKMAEKIVREFGENTFDVIESEPERLSDIKGITLSKAMTISSIFHEQVELRKAMIYLQEFGISPVYSMKIYKKYKDRTVETIQTNPYVLADDIYGIGFKLADEIAEKVGITKDSTFRIKAGVKYVLKYEQNNGHTYLPKENLTKYASTLLNIRVEEIENILSELQIERVIIQKKIDDVEIVYTNNMFYAENYIAKKLLELSENVLDKSQNISEDLEKYEKDYNIKLDEIQKIAVQESLEKGVLIITGGPGTGKTTTINSIMNILEQEGYELLIAAPTGRAAKRMYETTGREAKTIHRLLGINFVSDDKNLQTFEKNEENPIEADVIILDESSMIDTMLMYSFLKAVEVGTRLIFVGDVDQLPSVSAGNVLKDMIKSETLSVVRLEKIFRQAGESQIVVNAHKINKGEYPVLNKKDSDFYFVMREDIDGVISTIKDLITTRLPKAYNCNGFHDIQVLTPMRKSPLGATNLNNELQSRLNPKAHNKAEKEFRNKVFREGDKVMQIKNNYNLVWKSENGLGKFENGMGVFNGDEGIIKEINDGEEIVKVVFDENKLVEYDYTQLDELELSYAITIHKSQGSEYKIVVIPVHSGPPMLLSKNLLYTAVTRGKELVVLVGVEETLGRMVKNNRELNRFTSLDFYLREMSSFLRG